MTKCDTCGQQSLGFARCYFHLKCRANLFGYPPDGKRLSQAERLFVGLGVPTPRHPTTNGHRKWVNASSLLVSSVSPNSGKERRLDLVAARWIIDLPGIGRIEGAT